MTNIERIKAMSANQLAEELYNNYIIDCSSCPCDKYDFKECYKRGVDCRSTITKWLESKSS